MGLRSEADARRISSERERFERECATPKDDWEGNEKGYIYQRFLLLLEIRMGT